MAGPAMVKSKRFALRIIELCKDLRIRKKEYIMSEQILRSGTSIGANLAEAECAVSRKDLLSKLYIALKECSETRYWLELLAESDYIDAELFKSLYNDCQELMRILSSSTKTLSEEDRSTR